MQCLGVHADICYNINMSSLQTPDKNCKNVSIRRGRSMPKKKVCSIGLWFFPIFVNWKINLKILSIIPRDIHCTHISSSLWTLNFCFFFHWRFSWLQHASNICRYLDNGLQKCLWKLPFKYYIKVLIRKKINIVSILHQPIIKRISMVIVTQGLRCKIIKMATYLLNTSFLSVPGFNWSDGYRYAFLSLST